MEMGKVSLPKASTAERPDAAAAKVRGLLESRAPGEFPEKATPSGAQAWWRSAIEGLGVMVFFLPVGEDSCRGFSVWDDFAPVIVVNTWWRPEARIFTMLHELGHLLTRSNSACLEQAGDTRRKPSDPIERWCEAFAARVLIPAQQLRQQLSEKHAWDGSSHVTDLDVARSIARGFRVSTTAVVLRMISIGAASWALYRAIPRSHDEKSGGGGGGGERRPDKRIREYGRRTTQVFLQAVQVDVLGRDDVLGYLRVQDDELDEMAA
jgi:Zn-dependent peptidase ImmA (M78 family)